MEIRTDKVVDMMDIATLIHTITSDEDQAIALVGHHFPGEERIILGQDEARRQHQHVFMNTIDEEDEEISQDHNYTNWEMLLAATSFQAGNMSFLTSGSYKRKMNTARK